MYNRKRFECPQESPGKVVWSVFLALARYDCQPENVKENYISTLFAGPGTAGLLGKPQRGIEGEELQENGEKKIKLCTTQDADFIYLFSLALINWELLFIGYTSMWVLYFQCVVTNLCCCLSAKCSKQKLLPQNGNIFNSRGSLYKWEIVQCSRGGI